MLKTGISIVIVDDNRDFCFILSEYLKRHKDLNVVGVANDGYSAIELINSTEPDVVLLDIIMPHIDGLAILEKLVNGKMAKMPKVIMLSAIGHDNITQRAISLGADYYIVKPFDMDILVKRICDVVKSEQQNETEEYPKADLFASMASSKQRQPIESDITAILLEVGIPAHLKGFHYLREGIIMIHRNSSLLASITKDVYPGIATKYNTTSSRVERAIRHAIEVAWIRGRMDSINKIFSQKLYDDSNKPTNGEFISMIADKLKYITKPPVFG